MAVANAEESYREEIPPNAERFVYSRLLSMPIDLGDPTFVVQVLLECSDAERAEVVDEILEKKPDCNLRSICGAGLKFVFGKDYKKFLHLLNQDNIVQTFSNLQIELDEELKRKRKSRSKKMVILDEENFLDYDIYDGKYEYVLGYLSQIERKICEAQSKIERDYYMDIYYKLSEDEIMEWTEDHEEEEIQQVVNEISEAVKTGETALTYGCYANVQLNQMVIQNFIVHASGDQREIKEVPDLNEIDEEIGPANIEFNKVKLHELGPGTSGCHGQDEDALDYEPESPKYVNSPNEIDEEAEVATLKEIKQLAAGASSSEEVAQQFSRTRLVEKLRDARKSKQIVNRFRMPQDSTLAKLDKICLREKQKRFFDLFKSTGKGMLTIKYGHKVDKEFEQFLGILKVAGLRQAY